MLFFPHFVFDFRTPSNMTEIRHSVRTVMKITSSYRSWVCFRARTSHLRAFNADATTPPAAKIRAGGDMIGVYTAGLQGLDLRASIGALPDPQDNYSGPEIGHL